MMTKNEETLPWPSGWQIRPRRESIPTAVLQAWRSVPVAVVGDCIGRSVGTVGLRAYHPDLKTVLCGQAITVRTRPGYNLIIHKAMLMAQAGDVIVIDGGGDLTQALVGGLMRTTALAKNLSGFVIDGAVRDLVEWYEGGMPVFARGHTHRGPSKEGPGEVNVAVSCAGLVVQPGDLVLGDADGVIAIPAAELESLWPKVQAHLAHEEKIRKINASGVGDPERFDALLRAKGVPV